MLYFVCSTEYFLLTLALSLPPSRRAKASLRRDGGREREQPVSHSCVADGCWADSGTGVIERRWTILPLPRGGICLACSLRERMERDGYVASAWHRRVDMAENRRARKL